MKPTIYEAVTKRIIDHLERCQARDWHQPWQSVAGQVFHQNVDGRPYRGINVPLLMASPYESGVWATYKGWQKHGGQVRKGEKATQIVFWKQTTFETTDETGEKTTRPALIAKGYCVFAAEQVDGFNLDAHSKAAQEKLPNAAAAIKRVDNTLAAYRHNHSISLGHGGSRAYYRRSDDHIQIPPMAAFESTEAYYAVLLHEHGHSTGHESRLDRQFGKRFGDQAYAFEELVAELTSAMSCAAFNITDEPRIDHAQYLKSWLQILRQDNRAIFTAASKAQKAADMLVEAETVSLPVAA